MKTAILAFLMTFGSMFSAHADIPSVHGMLMFGDKKLYASHLPMFHAPHDYQLIMEISVSSPPRSITMSHYESAKANGAEQFTLEPQVMDLAKVLSGEIKNFQASLYEGHFERGGKKLGPVTVTIEKIVYSKKLDVNEQAESVNYLLFGADGEYFAAHLIKGGPSFDQILKIQQPTWERSAPCRTRVCDGSPIQVPVLDSNLPEEIHTLYSHEEAIQLQAGGILGSLLYNTVVLKPLYTEVNELSH